MIEVRIRHEDDTVAVPLCTWPIERLDELIPLLHRWGISYQSDTLNWALSGEFRLEGTAAFFEVLLSPPDATS